MIDGRAVTVGDVFAAIEPHIPLHRAARKWRSNNTRKAKDLYETPKHMRFYTLTQYLHWLRCTFSNADGTRGKNRQTVVHVHPRQCERCGGLFVADRSRTCGKLCPGK